MPQNEIQSEIFENLDVDNQMLGTFGSYEPFNSPWNAFFNCLTAQNFWSFFFDHPVDAECLHKFYKYDKTFFVNFSHNLQLIKKSRQAGEYFGKMPMS